MCVNHRLLQELTYAQKIRNTLATNRVRVSGIVYGSNRRTFSYSQKALFSPTLSPDFVRSLMPLNWLKTNSLARFEYIICG